MVAAVIFCFGRLFWLYYGCCCYCEQFQLGLPEEKKWFAGLLLCWNAPAVL